MIIAALILVSIANTITAIISFKTLAAQRGWHIHRYDVCLDRMPFTKVGAIVWEYKCRKCGKIKYKNLGLWR